MDIYESYVELVYGFELTNSYEKNQITKVIGYLKDNNYKDEEILKYLLQNGPIILDVLFQGLTKNIIYYNNELVIESKAPIWHPEKANTTHEYYREPRCSFDMNNLLDFFYSKLKVPYELRDVKRDSGAFKHLLDKYKFTNFSSLDFIITLIKLAEEHEMFTTSVFDIEKYANEAYDMLINLVYYNKTPLIWRTK